MRRHRIAELGFCIILAGLVQSCAEPTASVAPDAETTSAEVRVILPGDKQFDTPEFQNYEASYNSAMGKNGRFILQARQTQDKSKISLIDIIPMKDNVIVANRVIDSKSHNFLFSGQPYFAWGAEYVVAQNDGGNYSWVRTPIGGGDPILAQGTLENGGGVDVMFSPSLAALMPMDVGSEFQMPEIFPRKGGTVSSEMNQYKVLRRESLNLDSGLSCECWVIEKNSWGGPVTHYWVSRDAPFIFRRHRDVGGKRDFVSDVQSFRLLE